MKKIIKVLLAVVIGLVIILTSIYAYYGGFRTITFDIREDGGEIFVYENVTGDYSQSPVVMDSIYYALINDFNIETTKGAGLYYDNPQHVEKSKLRSEIGCMLDGALDSLKMAQLSGRFKIKILPRTNYIETKFPNKGMVSTFVGIMKIYPAMTDFVEKNGYKDSPVMEIYDVPTETIIYRKEAVK